MWRIAQKIFRIMDPSSKSDLAVRDQIFSQVTATFLALTTHSLFVTCHRNLVVDNSASNVSVRLFLESYKK